MRSETAVPIRVQHGGGEGIIPHFDRFFRNFEILGGYSGFADFSSFNNFEKFGMNRMIGDPIYD